MQSRVPIAPKGAQPLPKSTLFIEVENGINMARLHVVMGVHNRSTIVDADDDDQRSPSVEIISDWEGNSETESTSDDLSDKSIIPETPAKVADDDACSTVRQHLVICVRYG
jgi:hypothetical protein